MSRTASRLKFFEKFTLLVSFTKEFNFSLMVYYFHRTAEEQNRLYQSGRSKPGNILTYCDGYEKKSPHQEWLAIDAVIIKDGNPVWEHCPEYDLLGEIWRFLGGTWGGDFETLKDFTHFELKDD